MKTIPYIFFILMLSINSHAGTADLALTMNFDLSEYVELNQEGTFSITLSNNGPDMAGLGSASQLALDVYTNPIIPPDLFFILDTEIPQVCSSGYLILEPVPFLNIPLRHIYVFSFPKIASGESVTCYGRYYVGFNHGRRDILWKIGNIFDDDPNESNNEVNMIFRAAPAVIPVFSNLGILVLVLLILLMIYFQPKSHYKNH